MYFIWSTHLQYQLLTLLTFHFCEEAATVYVTKVQLEVVEYITKCTGQFLKEVMTVLGNSTNNYRLYN